MELLVVDDNVSDIELIKVALSQANFEINIVQALSVDEALEVIQKHSFDTILVDCRMPERDGFELLLEIKNLASERQIAIVMMSSISDEKQALKCIRAGAHDFIPKNDITADYLQRAVILATARSELDSKLRQSYERVKYLAEHDALTGISNRYMFDMCLSNSVSQASMEKSCVGLVLVSIDRFKFINDTYGHNVGDKLLQEFAHRLLSTLEDHERLFRVGGDEFAIVLNSLPYAHIGRISDRILEKTGAPFDINGVDLNLGVSIGVAFYPQSAVNAETLLRFADIAMYRAKKTGTNNICFIDDDVQSQFENRYRIENELREAIHRNELLLHFQPVMSAQKRSLVSCEALVRWNHPREGLIFPDRFVEIAEETGLIVDVGKWIIDRACQQLVEWQSQSDTEVIMALNVSPQQLHDHKLISFLDEKLFQYGLSPDQFEIEITETVLLKNTTDVMRTLKSLVTRGFSLALDDFGTGYSSIQHLHSFPISTVKIDRSLMITEDSPPKSQHLLRGLVSMLTSMELSIVAEGIEDENNANLCRSLGVERLQGYYFSKPVEPKQFHQVFLMAPAQSA